jgi:hypothetical protein
MFAAEVERYLALLPILTSNPGRPYSVPTIISRHSGFHPTTIVGGKSQRLSVRSGIVTDSADRR